MEVYDKGIRRGDNAGAPFLALNASVPRFTTLNSSTAV